MFVVDELLHFFGFDQFDRLLHFEGHAVELVRESLLEVRGLSEQNPRRPVVDRRGYEAFLGVLLAGVIRRMQAVHHGRVVAFDFFFIAVERSQLFPGHRVA